MAVPFEDMYKCLNLYRLCEPIHYIYRTTLLYDVSQQPSCILNKEIKLPCIEIS